MLQPTDGSWSHPTGTTVPERKGATTDASAVAALVAHRGRTLIGYLTALVQRLALQPGLAAPHDPVECVSHELKPTTDHGQPAGAEGASGRGARRAERPSGGPSSSLPHVLLVDDDPPVRTSLELLLHIEGYRVTAVASSAEARCRIVDGERPDLLVADYRLGSGATGLAVIDSVREAVGTPLKALLLTGDSLAVIQELPPDPLRRIGAKPFAAADLLSLIENLLGPDVPKARPLSLRQTFTDQGRGSSPADRVPGRSDDDGSEREFDGLR